MCPVNPAWRASISTASRTATARPLPTLKTGADSRSARSAASTAPATSRTSTKSRCASLSPNSICPAPLADAAFSRSAARPSTVPWGEPGPTVGVGDQATAGVQRQHGAELDDVEQRAVPARPGVPKQHRTPVRRQDHARHQQHERGREDEQDDGQRDVHHPLDRVVRAGPPLRGASVCSHRPRRRLMPQRPTVTWHVDSPCRLLRCTPWTFCVTECHQVGQSGSFAPRTLIRSTRPTT